MSPAFHSASWFAAPPPAVAVDIARDRVAVVGIRPGTSAVTTIAVEALPDGAVVPSLSAPNVRQRDVVVGALERALQRAGLGATRRAGLIVPDSVARVTLVTLENVPARPAELGEIIRWQVRKATPFPLEAAQVTWFAASRAASGATYAAVVARRDVLLEYEDIAAAVGIHAGLVDLAAFNVINAILAVDHVAGACLLIHAAGDATTLAVLRGGDLLFYRHRSAVDEEPIGALIHQTAMYHEDRLGGGAFARVWVAGPGSADALEQVSRRLSMTPEPIALTLLVDRAVTAGAEVLDAATAAIGLLVRNREAA